MSPTIRSTSLPTESRDYRPTTPLHIDRMEHGIQKHRKMSSTGGGRAWTEEEEAYLLRTRMHKMPYKHIAAHLHKTELACRLHYHQMSYGSNRRRRTESVSSINSFSGLSTTQECPLEYKSAIHMSTPLSPPSPESLTNSGASSIAGSPQQSRSHVPILPKPNTSSLHSMQSTPANFNKSLRLDTSFIHNNEHRTSPFDHPDYIDITRLRDLYDTYHDSFWSLIASEYSKGGSFPAAKLEEAFFHGALNSYRGRGLSPPTPGPSPQAATRELQKATSSTPGRTSEGGFHAINVKASPAITELNTAITGSSPVEKCAVASLLTVERDVWAPKNITTA
ncbi:hypothetical protein AJ79_00855 [Helicocarpus griseus UAMH5409]|uniref:Myb-like domain-containing protein n=1 Tax=Helicocarpus griseus UAMH5409 TaxID=1447875 RepID=A0A2B7Y8W7_9EURO|nr:hypothetical protein AJ79_00855 [Helicocarpus griseus UAMH5409]